MTPTLNKKNLRAVVDHLLDRHAGRIAIEHADQHCTYAELDARSRQLGARLGALGVNVGDVVALPLPAGIDYVVALLAVVRCGAVFMPLDPGFPEARLRSMLALARPRALVCDDRAIGTRLAQLGAIDGVLLAGEDAPAPDVEPAPVDDDATGYLIATSGSTGEPKLIAGINKGISHFVHWEVAQFGIESDVRVSSLAPPTFDVSLRDIFVPLLAGGTLVIPTASERADARRLAAWLAARRISLMHCVPSLLRLLTRALADGAVAGGLPDLRLVALAGEPLYGADVAAWRAAAGSDAQMVNLYGPSETTLAKAFYPIGDDIDAASVVPLGGPISNTALLVLRPDGQCEPGEVGELYINTPFASNGYVGNPALTSQVFVPNPFTPDGLPRLYRTGDLARCRGDGCIEFLGRADRQVKVGGVRIELAEVEGAMRRHVGVTEAVAQAVRLPDGEDVLVAYYTATDVLAAPDLRAAMQTALPESMLPAALLQLEAFPRNLNGKVDRKQLPRPEALLEARQAWVAPHGALEIELAALWAATLGLGRVGATSPWLQIGGNSLRAIGLIGRIGARFGVALTIRDFFEAATVRALAVRIAAMHTASQSVIPRAPEQDHYPLTPSQAGLWLLDRIDGARTLYNNVEWLELQGEPDSAALAAAFDALVVRHEALRTAYIEIDGAPRQRIVAPYRIALAPEALDAGGTTLAALLDGERARRFALESGRLLEVRLLRESASHHHLIINMHHLACDGWSMAILVRELCAAYRGAAVLPAQGAPGCRMRDVAIWLDGQADGARAAAWRTRLAQASERAMVPPEYGLTPGSALHAGQVRLNLPAPALLRARLAGQGATPFMGVAAALAIVLYRHGASEVVVIGTPLACRARPELADMVGFLVNTLPLVLRLDPGMTFAGLLEHVRGGVESLADGEFDQPHAWSGAAADLDPTRHPLFEVVLAAEPAGVALPLGELTLVERSVPNPPARNDLSLRLQDDGQEIALVLEYRTSLYGAATAQALLAQLARLLEGGATQPSLALGQLEMLEPAQLAALLQMGQGPARPLVRTTLGAAFARHDPAAIALVTPDTTLSYGWLDARANRIACALETQCAVRPGDIVAVLLEREPDWVASILAIVKLGAVYMPLDLWHPAARHAQLMRDAGIRALIAPAGSAASDVALLDPATLDDGLRPAPVIPADPDAPAYLIHTSGSTGAPKGVLVSHAAFLNMIDDQIDALGVGPGDTVLQFVAPGFDVSLFEVFLALLSGARLALAPRRSCNTADGFAEAVARMDVTVAAMTPGFLNTLGEAPLAALRLVISGGEAPIAADLRRLLARGIRCVNAYGPTEAAVCAAFEEIGHDGVLVAPLPLGRPTANTALHVVAPDLTLLPPGAVGELVITGAGLALGYLHGAGADAFVDGALGAARVYRTGDRVRRLPGGELIFVGRRDAQLKIRGHRVETAEVEAVLRALPGVRDARVLARALGADLELAAYWTGATEAGPRLPALLAERLPEYMVPRLLLQMDALPLSANGKLDAACLPQPTAPVVAGAPQNAIEAQLVTLWAELLDLPEAGRDTDFFAHGGRSLAANRLALRAARALGRPVALRDVYAAPTPAGLARLLSMSGAADELALIALADDAPAPLSPMQRRLWAIDQMGEGAAAYHIASLTGFTGALDRIALRAAFDDVAARHAVLRTRIGTLDGEPVQLLDPPGRVPWTEMAGADFGEFAARRFDLAREWPLRVLLAHTGAHTWQLLLVLHHIAADGWSMPILEADLAQAYRARLAATAPVWPALPAQYREVAAWQVAQLARGAQDADRDYWLTRLAEPAPPLDLPSDRPRPPLRRFRGASLDHVLSAPAVGAAQACARNHGVSLFTVLLAALQLLLYRASGQADLVIGMPVAARQHPASEGLVGFFVNTLALRERIDSAQGFGQRLSGAAAALQAALAHQNYPFERLVGELGIERDSAHAPLFDVMIGLDDASPPVAWPGVQTATLPLARTGSRCDLAWMFDVGASAPGVRIEYDSDLFDPERIADWARRFEHLLCAAAAMPTLALDRLDLLQIDERADWLRAAGAGAAPAPGTTPLALFEAHAARTPDRPAVVGIDVSWTYDQLNRAANRLAGVLRRHGCVAGAPVALLAGRGAAMVLGQMAAMKCGAPYVPLDADAPPERLARLLADCGAGVVLVEPGSASMSLPPHLTRIALAPPLDGDDSNGLPGAGPDDPVYVMYTSGSTGQPKGVVALGRGVVRLVQGADYYTAQPGDRVLGLSNPAFDGATFEVYAALCNGNALYLPARDVLLDPPALAAYIDRYSVNVAFLTTALFNRLVDDAPQALPAFRRLYFGGQEASLAHVRKAAAMMTPQALVHVYGPTECTTFATWHPVVAADVAPGALRLPIGRPVSQTGACLLDAHGMPLPARWPGELYLSGAGLAQGYLGQPEATAQRFIAAPFDPALRLYRTGDLCVRGADGTLAFLGRLDGQVKVRGFRVEIGEVEQRLASHPALEQVHVLPRTNAGGNVELVAYFTARGGAPSSEALAAHMAQALPRYMLPAHYVALDALPLNRNGKVDRGALPPPVFTAPAGPDTAAPDAREAALREAWQDVLGRAPIGLHDNYYALGGDSIQAIQIATRLRGAGLALKVTDLLRFPTIAQLGPRLEAAHAVAAAPLREGEALALTPIQHWLLERAMSAPQHFNQSALLQLPPGTGAAQLERALAALEACHPALRLRFGVDAGGKAWQTLGSRARVRLERHDCTGREGPRRLRAQIARLQRSLAPEQGPIWRAALFTLDGGERLFLTIHHWAVDGVSWRILLEDLAQSLAGGVEAPPLPAETHGLRDWVAALGAAAAGPQVGAQLRYWERHANTAAARLPLRADVAPAPVGERLMLRFSLDAARTDALFGACHAAYRTQSDELLVASWVRVQAQALGTHACRVVFESHGRDPLGANLDLGRTVGWFTAIYPQLFELDGLDWRALIRQVKDTLRAVPDHGVGYGLLRYLAQAPSLRGAGGEVVFNYLGRIDRGDGPLALAPEPSGDDLDPTLCLEQGLDLAAEVVGGCLQVRLVCDTARHPEAWFRALAIAFEAALGEVVAHCLAADDGALSPGDVGLAGLGIADLDGIFDVLEET